ncbi:MULTISPECIES: gluconokinase [unclassified Microbacterium]|uniref:gluconokinase n=1 Tax=unclassified Microbacterium TaxID=2609290 RepID=UPI00300FD07A
MNALPPVVVMGVSAVGKTSVGIEIARRTGGVFTDADDLHGEANIAKMSAGIPLDDADRWPWLDRVGEALVPGAVVACSALKRAYRDVLRRHAPAVAFVHLDADPDRLLAQASGRSAHFMPASLLRSQLDALEPLGADERGIVVTVDAEPATLAARAVALLTSPGGSGA